MVRWGVSNHLSVWKEFYCLFSQWQQRSVKCLGASDNFSDFQVAYSVVKYDDCCFLHSLCSASVALPVRVHVTSAERGPLPFCWIWKVFARILAGTLPVQDWPLTSHQAPGVWLCVLVTLEVLFLPSFSVVLAYGWEVSSIAFCSCRWREVFWWNSISGKTHFIEF